MKAILQGGSQGGSTITQQLVKNATNDDEVTPIRKLREIFRALDLERNLYQGGNFGILSEYYFSRGDATMASRLLLSIILGAMYGN